MLTRIRYLETLCQSKNISASKLMHFDTGLPGYTTANPVHAQEVRDAIGQLQKHFAAESPPRPLNSVVLGGPGSGKSYLAKQLGKASGAVFQEYNLSQFHEPAAMQKCFKATADWLRANPDGKILVFFDEFDVRIGGVAAIQFLIQPMYDGEMTFGLEKLEFKRAAFLFSGSYLKTRRVFDSIVAADQIDLARMLFDTYHVTFRQANAQVYRKHIWEELLAVAAYDPVQRMTAEREVVAYVRSLEKISDFVSRINGFVLELRNLSSPLHATRNHYRIELESKDVNTASKSADVAPDPQIAAQLIALMDGLRRGHMSEWFYAYTDPQQPVLQYKNLLLTDRLARTIDVLKRTYGPKPVRLSRALLHYLVTAPVVHGMRSLSTLVEGLADGKGELVMPGHLGVFERNIGRFHEFDNIDAVWSRTKRHNPVFGDNPMLSTVGAETMTVD